MTVLPLGGVQMFGWKGVVLAYRWPILGWQACVAREFPSWHSSD